MILLLAEFFNHMAVEYVVCKTNTETSLIRQKIPNKSSQSGPNPLDAAPVSFPHVGVGHTGTEYSHVIWANEHGPHHS